MKTDEEKHYEANTCCTVLEGICIWMYTSLGIHKRSVGKSQKKKNVKMFKQYIHRIRTLYANNTDVQ